MHRRRLRLVAGGTTAPTLDVTPAPEPGAVLRLALAPEPLEADGPLRPVIVHKTTHRRHYERLRLPGVDDVICHNSRGELTEGTFGNLALLLGGPLRRPRPGHLAARRR